MTDRGHGRLIGESTTTRSYQSMEQSEAQKRKRKYHLSNTTIPRRRKKEK